MKGETVKLIFNSLTAQRQKGNECALTYPFQYRLYSQITRNINYCKYLITMNEQPCDI